MLEILGLLFLLYLLSKTSGISGTDVLSSFNFDYSGWQYQLGLSESNNNYLRTNSIGALGRYQFMPTTIRRISEQRGLTIPTNDEFLRNTILQDDYFHYMTDQLKTYIENNLFSFYGKQVTGKTNKINTTINIYGLLAGGWLSGQGNLINFLYYGKDISDGDRDEGTYISDYIAKFSKIF